MRQLADDEADNPGTDRPPFGIDPQAQFYDHGPISRRAAISSAHLRMLRRVAGVLVTSVLVLVALIRISSPEREDVNLDLSASPYLVTVPSSSIDDRAVIDDELERLARLTDEYFVNDYLADDYLIDDYVIDDYVIDDYVIDDYVIDDYVIDEDGIGRLGGIGNVQVQLRSEAARRVPNLEPLYVEADRSSETRTWMLLSLIVTAVMSAGLIGGLRWVSNRGQNALE